MHRSYSSFVGVTQAMTRNCTMEGTDLAFEYSDVEATVEGHVDSIKNPRSGKITVDSVGEIILGDTVMECTGEVQIRQTK